MGMSYGIMNRMAPFNRECLRLGINLHVRTGGVGCVLYFNNNAVHCFICERTHIYISLVVISI